MEKREMSINLKLFHLGNKVVSVRSEIDSSFGSFDDLSIDNIRKAFIDILNLLNEMRLAIQDQEIAESDPKITCEYHIICTEKERHLMESKLRDLKLNFSLRAVKIDQK